MTEVRGCSHVSEDGLRTWSEFLMKILVVEDDPASLSVIRNALKFNEPRLQAELEERGIQVSPVEDDEIIEARDRESAEKKILEQKSPFDLAILDLFIPKDARTPLDFSSKEEYSGYDVLSLLRQKFREDTPILIYSNVKSEPDPEHNEQGLAGFFRILRERAIAPPNEVLWKAEYATPKLMRKLVRYVVDLTADDEERLRQARILVPHKGTVRRVLRELKRMACSANPGFPRSDVLLLGENGVGKSTFARAYHLLRPRQKGRPYLGFQHLDLGSLDFAGSAPNIALFGATDFNGAWSLGAFARSTLYRQKSGVPLQFPGQEFESGYEPDSVKTSSARKARIYPDSSDTIDFDGSGTLFLDEVVNVSLEIQAMLLQAISYDLHSRHVYTTGHVSRRLQVAPSLVFATAQDVDRDLSDANPVKGPDAGSPFRSMRDYIFRIDQIRVRIPPLRDREPDEIVALLIALLQKRRPSTTSTEEEIMVDPIVLHLLEHKLFFRNNVADLQRIADQVMPEESTITWQHVAPLYAREQPVLAEIRTKLALTPSGYDQGDGNASLEYYKATQILESYRRESSANGVRCSLSQLPRRMNISQRDAYNVGLVFMEKCGCLVSKHWPKDDQILQVFDHGTKMFQTYLHRLSGLRNAPFKLNDALDDLAALKLSKTSTKQTKS